MRADARAIAARQEFRRSAGRFREVGAHLLDVSHLHRRARVLSAAPVRVRSRDLREIDPIFEHTRQQRIGVAIDLEQAHCGFIAHGRQPGGYP
jgi:hypothetical protein